MHPTLGLALGDFASSAMVREEGSIQGKRVLPAIRLVDCKNSRREADFMINSEDGLVGNEIWRQQAGIYMRKVNQTMSDVRGQVKSSGELISQSWKVLLT